MIKYLFLIVLFPVFQSGIEGVYARSKAVGPMGHGLNKMWELTLNKDSSFEYVVNAGMGFVSYSPQSIKGRWGKSHDTLTLKSFNYPFIIEYVMKSDTLIPITEDKFFRDQSFPELDMLVKR